MPSRSIFCLRQHRTSSTIPLGHRRSLAFIAGKGHCQRQANARLYRLNVVDIFAPRCEGNKPARYRLHSGPSATRGATKSLSSCCIIVCETNCTANVVVAITIQVQDGGHSERAVLLRVDVWVPVLIVHVPCVLRSVYVAEKTHLWKDDGCSKQHPHFILHAVAHRVV